MSRAARRISGVAALGKSLGVSKPAAAAYLKRADWQFGPGPWDAELLPLMRQWRADTLRPANKPAETPVEGSIQNTLNKLKAKKLIEDIEGVKILNAARRGELVDRAEVEARHCTVLEMIKRRLMTMPNRLPFDEAIKNVVRQHVREEFELLAGPASK